MIRTHQLPLPTDYHLERSCYVRICPDPLAGHPFHLAGCCLHCGCALALFIAWGDYRGMSRWRPSAIGLGLLGEPDSSLGVHRFASDHAPTRIFGEGTTVILLVVSPPQDGHTLGGACLQCTMAWAVNNAIMAVPPFKLLPMAPKTAWVTG